MTVTYKNEVTCDLDLWPQCQIINFVCGTTFIFCIYCICISIIMKPLALWPWPLIYCTLYMYIYNYETTLPMTFDLLIGIIIQLSPGWNIYLLDVIGKILKKIIFLRKVWRYQSVRSLKSKKDYNWPKVKGEKVRQNTTQKT